MQALGLVRIAEELVMQALALVMMSKTMKFTVLETEGVLDEMRASLLTGKSHM